MPNGNINPYEYYSEFQNPYTSEQAYDDIGLTPTQEFLGTTDPGTGRTYSELIPGYDPYAEQEMATQFSQGAQSAYQSSVGQLAGVGRGIREAQAKSGFAGGGAGQAQMRSAGRELKKSYGQSFQGALLDLVGGIRKERMGYQEQLASLLEAYSAQAPEGVQMFETDTPPDPSTFAPPKEVAGDPFWSPPQNPTAGQTYDFEGVTYYFNPMSGWSSSGG